MEGTEQKVIRRGDIVKCLKRFDGDTEVERAMVTEVHDEGHISFGWCFGMKHRAYVSVRFIEVLSDGRG